MNKSQRNTLEMARDELFGHINRCGVLRATQEQQEVWMEDTIGYLAECHPGLTDAELGELRAMGLRFCRPVIHNAAASEPAKGDASEAAAA